MRRRIGVLLDTNILLLIGDGVDVFSQIEELLLTKPTYYVIKPVIEELEKLSRSRKPSLRRKARLALELARRLCVVIEPPRILPSVDDMIAETALIHGLIVATSDRGLRRKLREKGVPEIYYREEKHMLEAAGIEAFL